jgi:hypothetical protein
MKALILTFIMRHVNCQKKNLRVRQNVTWRDEGHVGYHNVTPQILIYHTWRPSQWATRSAAWVYSRSLVGIAGSNPAGAMDVFLL